MEAKAVARTIRIAPRKVRLVLDLIRGKNAAEAIAILKLTNKASSPVIEKVLMSALANAEHNYDMNTDELVVKEAYANEGPTLKRFRMLSMPGWLQPTITTSSPLSSSTRQTSS